MADESKREAMAAMREINRAWLGGQLEELEARVHREVAMVLPGFAESVPGRDAFLAGFREFLQSATVQEFHEHDWRADVAGATAVVTFRYEMVYARAGQSYRSTGRDLWVFERQDRGWIAVWRTMLDMQENPA
jgi:ketosteroid isomerase-like protein